MAEYTQNYNLYKPSRDDDLDVDTTLADNFTKIDSELKTARDNAATSIATADEAAQSANESKIKSDELQTQLNQLVVSGDSSIEAAQARVLGDGTSFETLRDRLNASDQLLAEKAEKGQITKSDLKTSSDADLLDLNNFNEATRSVLQGLTPGQVNAVLGLYNVLSENLSSDSVTARAAKFLTKSSNLFNRKTASSGLLDYTTGTVTASSNDMVSDYIEALPNMYYGSYPSGQFAFYDKNKTFISGVSNTNFATNRKAPANAAYVRLGLTKANFDFNQSGKYVQQLNMSPTAFASTPAYEDYYVKFGDLQLKTENIPAEILTYIFNNIPRDSIKTTSLKDQSVSPRKTSFMDAKTNPVGLDNLIKSGSLNYSTGVVSASTTEYVTSNIDVVEFRGKYAVASLPAFATVFDSGGAVIGQWGNINGVASRQVPTNADYMIIGMTVSNYNASVSQKGGTIIKFFDAAQTSVTQIDYEDVTPILKGVKVDFNALKNSSFAKLSSYDFYKSLFNSCICVGDSITEGYRASVDDTYRAKSYPAYLSKMSGWNVVNGGESGATTTRWWTVDFPKYNYVNYDIAIIKLGQNEGLTDTLAADTATTPYADTNTGDYCKIIEGILAQNPNIKIFLVPIQNDADTVTNGVIQQIAAKYNLPYLDISNNGVYTLTDSNYHTSASGTSYGVHFNTVGYLTLAKVIFMLMMGWMNQNYNTFKDY